MNIVATDRAGLQYSLAGEPGQTLMDLLRDEGLGVEAICGGSCSCATCHVFIDLQRVGSPGELESDLLDVLEYHDPATSRLSCQITLSPAYEGLAVTVAPEE